ncbi:Uu.00g139160.m01.CDS01 [Anthostomella pinea]|uniref:Uu.00g139160.m01.CDS01 n=1 Tax=Anthostomella pinea TaxID=933095 RepID=A0AAI8VJE6_9PEZI|nr:Uu.00g139160.m01.CDS01 [Anthostomella pinea]
MAHPTSPEPGATRMVEIHPTGITELYVPSSPIADICFVHGFTGHPKLAWQSKKRTKRQAPTSGSSNPFKRRLVDSFIRPKSQSNTSDSLDVPEATSERPGHVYWPRDLVPHIVPEARVLTFGYDTHIRHSLSSPNSANRLIDHANDFLSALEACRRDPTRPLIFVAHSLGGLLVKDTLRLSKGYAQHQPDRSLVYESTTNLLFFGTPHAGADPLNSTFRALTNLLQVLGLRVNHEIVQTLMPAAERLILLRDDFQSMINENDWVVHTFQEELAHTVLSRKIVEDSSSCINDRRQERVVHIHADHVDMCRFSGNDDPEFRKVAAELRRVDESLLSRKSGTAQDVCADGSFDGTLQPERSIPTPEQREKLIEMLSFDGIDARYMTLRTAQTKTCQWLPKHSEYKAWQNPTQMQDHHGFLWIKGKPGAGKSVMMKYLLQNARRAKKRGAVISFFFNARGGNLERSVKGLYRSLLSQLLRFGDELHIDPDLLELLLGFEDDKPWPIETLKEAIGSVVEHLGTGQLCCFIDALDECPEDEIRDMILFFEDVGEKAAQANSHFRLCFSSRHYPYIAIRKGLQIVLEDETDHADDIRHYISSKLRIGLPAARPAIEVDIFERSFNIFLWAALVVDILNREHDKGRNLNAWSRLKQIPTGLHELFQDILTRDTENLDQLVLCIQWVLYAKRPLRPEELYFALHLGIDPISSADWDERSISMGQINRFNLDVSKGLTEVTKKKPVVQFIHESVRDYLLRDNGLQTLLEHRTDVRGFGEGYSQDALKNSCLTQMRQYLSSPGIESYTHTADSAQNAAFDQAEFLSIFPRGSWIKLDNMLQKYRIRRHSIEAHLLYILAEQNLANLISIHPERHHTLVIEAKTERYPSPLCAAMALGQHDAIRSLTLEAAIAATSEGDKDLIFRVREELSNLSHLKSDLDGKHWRSIDLLECLLRIGSQSLVGALWYGVLGNPEDALAKISIDAPFAFSQCLIQNGARVDVPRQPSRLNILGEAVGSERLDLVRLLLSLGTNSYRTSEIVLSLPELAGISEMAKFFLEHDASPGFADHWDKVLFKAMNENRSDLVAPQ